MINATNLWIFLSILTALNCVSSQHPSPCPEVFRYEPSKAEPGLWAGQLILESEFPLSGVWIKFILDRKVQSVKSTFGEVITYDSKEFLIKDRDFNLLPGSALKIPISVIYSTDDPIPSFVSVRLNGRTVCPGKTNGEVSKCPGVFSYNKDKIEDNMWHGILNLDSEFELKGVWIRIVLDSPAELLGNEFGEIRTTDNLQYLISNRNHTLVPGRALRLPFWVKYSPDGLVPTIHTVRLNGRTVCGQIISEDNNK